MKISKLQKDLAKLKISHLNIDYIRDIKDIFSFYSYVKFININYSIDFLEYQKIYHEINKKIYNFSFFIKSRKQNIAYCPLYILKTKKKFEITSDFNHITRPLIADNINDEETKHIIKFYLEIIFYIKQKLNIKQISFISNNFNNNELNHWDKKLIQYKYTPSLTFNQSIDLTKDENMIWSNLRKSYKSLINKNKKRFDINIYDGQDKKIWNNFKKFHLVTAKRKTRSLSSWKKQFNSIKTQSAFFFYILENNKMIAGSFFDTSKNVVNYSVGVYDRSRKDIPLAHLILNQAIFFFKKKNYKYLNLGKLMLNDKNIDKKILNIQKFKSGFANRIDFEIIYT